MKEFLEANGGMIATVSMVVVCMNIMLTAVKSVLEKIKDKTATQVDNKAYEIVAKISAWLGKIVDWMSANKEH